MLTATQLLSGSYAESSAAIAHATQEFILDDLGRQCADLTPDLRDGVLAYFQRGGKSLRPVLLMLSALTAGGDEVNPDAILPACAAVECYHTATLVHDDVIDHDAMRRGQPTVHTLIASAASQRHPLLNADGAADFGKSTAIIAGDLILGYSTRLLANLPDLHPEIMLSIIRYQLSKLHPGLLQGEQLDVELSSAPLSTVTPEAIALMMRLKTGLLLEFAAYIGAAIGAKQTIEQCQMGEKLGLAAQNAGLAFQLQDDILGMYGDAAKLGKPIGSDIREGKRTLLVINAWQNADDAARNELERIIGNPDCTAADLDTVRTIVEATGSLNANRAEADRLAEDSAKTFQGLSDSRAAALLTAWNHLLTHRQK